MFTSSNFRLCDMNAGRSRRSSAFRHKLDFLQFLRGWEYPPSTPPPAALHGCARRYLWRAAPPPHPQCIASRGGGYRAICCAARYIIPSRSFSYDSDGQPSCSCLTSLRHPQNSPNKQFSLRYSLTTARFIFIFTGRWYTLCCSLSHNKCFVWCKPRV